MASAPAVRWRVPLADVVVSEDGHRGRGRRRIARAGSARARGRASSRRRWRRYTGAPHAIAVDQLHGGAAPHGAASRASGRATRSIVPSLTFVATANAIAYTGATPVFADIVAPDRAVARSRPVRARITPRTKAIVLHAVRRPPGRDRRAARARGRARPRCCSRTPRTRSARASASSTPARSGSRAPTASSRTRISPVGEGGMVVCRDDEAAARLRLLRSHGMTTLSWQRHQGHAASYDVVALGPQLPHRRGALRARTQPARAARRRERAGASVIDARYRELLARRARRDSRRSLPPRGATLAHHLFTRRPRRRRRPRAVRERLARCGRPDEHPLPAVHRFRDLRGSGARDCPSPTRLPAGR